MDPAHLGRGTNSKLNASDVVSIRFRLLAGDRQEDVAQDFRITVPQVSRIWTRESWRCQEGCETTPPRHKRRPPKPRKPRQRPAKPRVRKPRARRVQCNFRAEAALAEAISAAAKAQGITKSEFIRRALRAEVARTFAEVGVDGGVVPEAANRAPAVDASPPKDEEEIELIMAQGYSRVYAAALYEQRQKRRKK